MAIKAIIFDWGRTLFDSDAKKEFPEAEGVLASCAKLGYRLALVSLVTVHANSTLDERKKQIENSPLKKYFEMSTVTDSDKDRILDETVQKLNLPTNYRIKKRAIQHLPSTP